MRKDIIVIGAGKIGNYIANRLSLSGEAVIVIDKDQQKLNYLPVTYSGFVYCGNAADYRILEKNYANTAKTIIITTPNDNLNIFVAHLAKFLFDIPQVIIRLNDPEKGILVRNMGVDVVFPFSLSISELNKFIKETNL